MKLNIFILLFFVSYLSFAQDEGTQKYLGGAARKYTVRLSNSIPIKGSIPVTTSGASTLIEVSGFNYIYLNDNDYFIFEIANTTSPANTDDPTIYQCEIFIMKLHD